MASIAVPALVFGHITRAAEKGESLGEALTSLIAETGPIDVKLMNLGEVEESIRIYSAGADFLIVGLFDEAEVRKAVAPLSAIQWIDFSES